MLYQALSDQERMPCVGTTHIVVGEHPVRQIRTAEFGPERFVGTISRVADNGQFQRLREK